MPRDPAACSVFLSFKSDEEEEEEGSAAHRESWRRMLRERNQTLLE